MGRFEFGYPSAEGLGLKIEGTDREGMGLHTHIHWAGPLVERGKKRGFYLLDESGCSLFTGLIQSDGFLFAGPYQSSGSFFAGPNQGANSVFTGPKQAISSFFAGPYQGGDQSLSSSVKLIYFVSRESLYTLRQKKSAVRSMA